MTKHIITVKLGAILVAYIEIIGEVVQIDTPNVKIPIAVGMQIEVTHLERVDNSEQQNS